jgi:serine/threonine protein kinase
MLEILQQQQQDILKPLLDKSTAEELFKCSEVSTINKINADRVGIQIKKIFQGTSGVENKEAKSAEKNTIIYLTRGSSTGPVLKSLAENPMGRMTSVITWPIFIETKEEKSETQFFIGAEQDLFDYINENRTEISIEQAEIIAKQLILLTEYLHNNNWVHRDIKIENFLIFSTDNGSQYIKYCDIGTMRKIGIDGESIHRSEAKIFKTFIDPQKNKDLRMGDCFLLGISFFWIFITQILKSREELGISDDEIKLIMKEKNLGNNLGLFVKKLQRIINTSSLPEKEKIKLNQFIDLIQNMTNLFSGKRWNITQAKQHEFFSNDILKEIKSYVNEIYEAILPENYLTLGYVHTFLQTKKYQEIPFKPNLKDLTLIVFNLVKDRLTGLTITEEEIERRLCPEEYIDGQYVSVGNLRIADISLLVPGERSKEIYYHLLTLRQNLEFFLEFLKGNASFQNNENIINTLKKINEHRLQIIKFIEESENLSIPNIEVILASLKENTLSKEHPCLSQIFKKCVELDFEVAEAKSSSSDELDKFQQSSAELVSLIQAEIINNPSYTGLNELQHLLSSYKMRKISIQPDISDAKSHTTVNQSICSSAHNFFSKNWLGQIVFGGLIEGVVLGLTYGASKCLDGIVNMGAFATLQAFMSSNPLEASSITEYLATPVTPYVGSFILLCLAVFCFHRNNKNPDSGHKDPTNLTQVNTQIRNTIGIT